MVGAAPNRTRVTARVLDLHPHPETGKWDVLSLEVVSSEALDGQRDMIRAEPGQRLDVVVDRDWLPAGEELPGTVVSLDATVAGPDVVRVAYAEPAVRVLR
jgi:hypothetical protein